MIIKILLRCRHFQNFTRMRHLVNHIFVKVYIVMTFGLMSLFVFRFLFWDVVQSFFDFVHQYLVDFRLVVNVFFGEGLVNYLTFFGLDLVHLVHNVMKLLVDVLSESSNMVKQLFAHGN